MQALDLNKVKELQKQLQGGPALAALNTAVVQFLESEGTNFVALATLQKAGVIEYPDPAPKIPDNVTITADGEPAVQLLKS